MKVKYQQLSAVCLTYLPYALGKNTKLNQQRILAAVDEELES